MYDRYGDILLKVVDSNKGCLVTMVLSLCWIGRYYAFSLMVTPCLLSISLAYLLICSISVRWEGYKMICLTYMYVLLFDWYVFNIFDGFGNLDCFDLNFRNDFFNILFYMLDSIIVNFCYFFWDHLYFLVFNIFHHLLPLRHLLYNSVIFILHFFSLDRKILYFRFN